MAQNRQKGQGAGQGDRVSSAGEAIPMQKAGLTTYVAIGVGVLVIGGTIAITSGGSDSEAEKKAVDIQTQANQQDAPQMTAKEQQEHLKMTARAFERAEESSKLKKAEQARQQAAAKAAKAQEQEQANAKPGAAVPAARPAAPPPKAVDKKVEKKQLDSLDSIGSDIASALE